MHRFHIPTLTTSPPGHPLPLPDHEAHHARSVLRLTPGSPAILFDGHGHWLHATLTSLSKREALFTPTSPLHTDPLPSPTLTLASAIPKGDRAEWLIDQASQLGVHTLLWLHTDRSVAKITGDHKLDKHRRLAIESAKQSHRTHLLQIHLAPSLEKLLVQTPPPIFWLDPAPTDSSRFLASLTPPPNSLALIGPEGGWSDPEIALLSSHPSITRARLTPTILRIETAAATTAALLLAPRQ